MTSGKAKSGKTRRKWIGGRGALLIIGLLFAGSASLRVATGAGPAIAKEMAALSASDAAEPVPEICKTPDDIAAILAELQVRDEQLSSRERNLLALERSLVLAEQKVRENLVALQQAEATLDATISRSEDASETDLMRLTAVYEGMKPKDAAGLFEEMDPDFAAGFVGRMRPDAAAAIMTGLSPTTAYSISVILAGRNANAPTK